MSIKAFMTLVIAVLVLGGSIGGAFIGGVVFGKYQADNTIGRVSGLLGAAGGQGLASARPERLETFDSELAPLELKSRVSQLEGENYNLVADLEEADSAHGLIVDALAVANQNEEALQLQLSEAERREDSALHIQAQLQSRLELQTLDQQPIASLEEDRAVLKAVRDMSGGIEKHRILLVELRKEAPQAREETMAYWDRIKTIAAQADPKLSSPADRVITRIDNFYAWNVMSPDPADSPDQLANRYQDWQALFSISGAEAYVEATDSFTREALLSVINQIDSVISKLN